MLFSIGPVQEFIAQARKTRDLWFGSYLLSELSKAAALELRNYEAELIFPVLSQIDSSAQGEASDKAANVANKVLVVVKTADPRQIALAVRSAVDAKWRYYTDRAKEKLGSSINPGMWQQQIKDLVEFYAVWSTFQQGEEYTTVLNKVEGLMAARKTLKDFRPNDPSKLFGDVKSTLDGGRESVLWPERYAELSRYGIKINEALDAISLVKRMSRYAGERREFKSVCDVAFLHFRQVLSASDQEMKQAVQEYYKYLQHAYPDMFTNHMTTISDYDSRLFFENRVGEYVSEENRSRLEAEDNRRITQEISAELQKLYAQIGTSPSPYYAFVVCDGDRMGNALRKLNTYQEHQQFSEALSSFAMCAESIIREHQGELIYSGGDDIMAYLPLHTCLEAVQQVRDAFVETMSSIALTEESWQDKPTLSVGIAIVHMMEMLGEARRHALIAEKTAKQKRNQLAFHFQKRSGGNALKFSLSFEENPIQRILFIQQGYRAGLFSIGFAYGLRDLHREYNSILRAGWGDSEHTGRLQVLLKQEVTRLAYKKLPNETVRERVEMELLPIFDGSEGDNATVLERFGHLAEQFIIAVTLVKAGDIYDKNDTDQAT